MRRSRRKRHSQNNSLDSFLDVVSNLIGALLLIALIAALSSEKQVFDVFTPVERPAENKEGLSFAVTGEGIFPLHKERAMEKLLDELKTDPARRAAKVATDYFEWLYGPYEGKTVLLCKLKSVPAAIGEQNMDSIPGEVGRLCRQSESEKQCFAFFFVAPSNEAFRMFRIARKALWSSGIDVGWTPMDPREGIVFVEHGRSMTVQ